MNMLPLKIVPISHPLDAVVHLPGSKSLTNRALLVAALADGEMRLTGALFSDDSLYFVNCLQTLGFAVQTLPDRQEIIVTGQGGRIPAIKGDLFVGDAGTAARFLTAFLALGEGEYRLDGDERMRQRPIGDLASALVQLGADVRVGKGSCPPVQVTAHGLAGGEARLSGDISSQFLSALLMVSPYARRPVRISLTTELASRPYVDMTIRVMCDFGVRVEQQGYDRFDIVPSLYRRTEPFAIDPDASAASYFFAAPALCGGKVRVENMNRASVQGDLAFLEVLKDMGCSISEGENFIEVSGASILRGVDVDMRDIPDTAQTLAALAPFAATPTRIRGIASARLKESDRITATSTELARLGVKVEQHPDGMTIHPCRALQPAMIRTYNDHRMAMAFALIGLQTSGISIENPGCVAKTFPGYFDTLEHLR